MNKLSNQPYPSPEVLLRDHMNFPAAMHRLGFALRKTKAYSGRLWHRDVKLVKGYDAGRKREATTARCLIVKDAAEIGYSYHYSFDSGTNAYVKGGSDETADYEGFSVMAMISVGWLRKKPGKRDWYFMGLQDTLCHEMLHIMDHRALVRFESAMRDITSSMETVAMLDLDKLGTYCASRLTSIRRIGGEEIGRWTVVDPAEPDAHKKRRRAAWRERYIFRVDIKF